MPVTIIDNCLYTDKYTKPIEDDNGDEFGEAIEDFMERMAAHNHDGTTSNSISLNITKGEEVILSSDIGWADEGNGTRSKVINSYDDTSRSSNHFRTFYVGDSAINDWEQFFPKIVWDADVNVNSYTLYTNYQTKDIKVFTT